MHRENYNYDDNYFRTSDLGCSNALVVLGYELDYLDRSDPARVIFVFEQKDHLSEIVDQYWSGNLSVNAKNYSESLKWLKSRIYNG